MYNTALPSHKEGPASSAVLSNHTLHSPSKGGYREPFSIVHDFFFFADFSRKPFLTLKNDVLLRYYDHGVIGKSLVLSTENRDEREGLLRYSTIGSTNDFVVFHCTCTGKS